MSQLSTATSTTTLLSVKLHLPEAGCWRADVVLEKGAEAPTGSCTLSVSDLSLLGSVLRSDMDAADRPHAVIVGGIGWLGLVTKPISFQSDSGVRLSTVLDTLSRETGQPIEKPTDKQIGNYFEIISSRQGEPVHWSEVLDSLVRAGHVACWRVDPDGVTRFMPRVSVAFSGRSEVLERHGGIGIVKYGLDNTALLLPGNTIDSALINRVDIKESSGAIEAEVYTTAAAPEIRELFRRMISAWVSDSIRTYVVDSIESDGRLNLAPPADAPHLPEIAKAEQWILGGAIYRALKGDEVIVAFADGGRHERPMVIGVKATTTDEYFDAARISDTIKVLFPPMTFSGTVGGLPATGVILSSVPYTLGSIQTGSQRVGIRTT